MPPRCPSSACALLLAALASQASAQGTSLRFTNDSNADPALIQRVRVPIGLDSQPANLNPPMDLGDPATSPGGSFTIEFWLRGVPAQNPNGSGCALGGTGWIGCHIVVDRDINGSPDFGDFGLSVCNSGSIRAGVEDASGPGEGVCDLLADALDGAWHHIAFTRDAVGGLCLFVDGVQGDCRSGPAGIPGGGVSYDDTRSPSSPTGQDPTLVLAAEKHGFGDPGFRGWLDDARFSSIVRYAACGNGNPCFAPPTAPFATDASTLGLYGFDEAAAGAPCSCAGPLVPVSAAGTCVLDASAGGSDAECRYGRTGNRFGPSYSAYSPYVLGDADGDTIQARMDNCPFWPNLDQLDGTGSTRDGVGDACECGDNDADGVPAEGDDITRLRNTLAGLAPGIAEVQKCSVAGGQTDCNLLDLAVLRRTALLLAPGIADVCDAAVP